MRAEDAKRLLEVAHKLWAEDNLEGVLSLYTDDCVYASTTGGLEGVPLRIDGKNAYRTYLQPIMAANESVSSVIDFSYSTGMARARIAIFIKHKQTGHKITTTYRQIVTYRDGLICGINEYHDVARLSTFWRMANQDSVIGSEI